MACQRPTPKGPSVLRRILTLFAAAVLVASLALAVINMTRPAGQALCVARGGLTATLLTKNPLTGRVTYQYDASTPRGGQRGCIVTVKWPRNALRRHAVGSCVVPLDPFAQCADSGGGDSW
jgi:hypothetical protein